MRRILTLLLCLLTTFAFGQTHLNGLSSYKHLNKEFYLAALYTTNPINDVEALLADNQSAKMVMRVTVKRWKPKTFAKMWIQDLSINNNLSDDSDLAKQLFSFTSIPKENLTVGDEFVVSFQPDSGTTISLNGDAAYKTDGKGVFNAILRAWVGSTPPSRQFQSDILGNEPNKPKQHEALTERYNGMSVKPERVGIVAQWYQADKAVVLAKLEAEKALKKQQQREAKAKIKAAEAKKKAAEAKKKAAEAKKRAEAAKIKAAADKKKADEAKRLAVAKKKAEAKKLAEEKKKADANLKAEARKKAEAIRAAEAIATAKAEEEARKIAEAKQKQEEEERQKALALAEQQIKEAEAEAAALEVAAAAEAAALAKEEQLLSALPAISVASPSADVANTGQQIGWDEYKDQLISEIKSEIVYPKKAKRSRQKGLVRADVIINADGSVKQIKLKRITKYELLNDEISKAVERIGEFEEFPSGVEEETVTVSIEHRFR